MPSTGKGEPESASASRSAGPVVARERIHGGGSIAAGLGVIALAIALATGLLPVDWPRSGRGEVDRIVPIAVGALTAGSGLWLVALGAGAMRRASRRRRLLAERPWEPWMADHPWSREGASDETGQDVAGAFRSAGQGLLVAAFGALLLLARPDAGEGQRLFLAALVALPLVPAAWGGYLLARRARHGRVELRFARFPFFLGEAVEAELVRPPGGPALGKVRARLRCIEEQVLGRVRGFGKRAPESVLHEVGVEVVCGHGGQLRIPLRIALPSDAALATDLAGTPRQFWRLEVSADVPGIDLGAKFLVPVYARARPGAGPAPPAAGG